MRYIGLVEGSQHRLAVARNDSTKAYVITQYNSLEGLWASGVALSEYAEAVVKAGGQSIEPSGEAVCTPFTVISGYGVVAADTLAAIDLQSATRQGRLLLHPYLYSLPSRHTMEDTSVIELLPGSVKFDFEVALGVVVGSNVVNPSVAVAGESIGGLCGVVNWVARDWEDDERDAGIGPGKSSTRGYMCGPYLLSIRPGALELILRDSDALRYQVYRNDTLIHDGRLSTNAVFVQNALCFAGRGTKLHTGDLLTMRSSGVSLRALYSENPILFGGWLMPGDELMFTGPLFGNLTYTIAEPSHVNPLTTGY